jgi:LPS-assembly protein
VPGELSYEDQQLWFRGRDARYSFAEESGQFTWIDYGLTGSSANGSAEMAELIGGHTSILHRVDYTSCPGSSPDWQLTARELELQHEEGMGTARGAKLTFKGVPILYAPWFTFPLDDRRKSGFLYPNLGHNSDSGFEIGVPWYWNIAPNHDAVIEPRYYTNRGFMLATEYRFLTRRSNGFLEAEYLPNDKETREERYRYLFEHLASPWPRWNTALIADRVSDNRYYQDFGTSLGQTSRQFLRSSAELSGVGRYWNLQLMADDFQVIDESVPPSNEPYRRLPRLAYWSDRPLGSGGLSLAVDAELVYFDRQVGTTGARADFLPRLYWDLQQRWGFLKPSVGYRYTTYDLDPEEPAADDSPSTGVAIASLDAGLVFDRRMADGDLQTLEPRLFYLYVPNEEQDDQPLFDTGRIHLRLQPVVQYQPLRRRRPAGRRQPAVDGRLHAPVRRRHRAGAVEPEPRADPLFRAAAGAARGNRRHRRGSFALPGGIPLAPVLARQRRGRPAVGLGENQLDLGMVGVQYRGEQGRRAAFEYRFRRDRVDQFDLRFYWPINDSWRVLSRVNYSFDDNDLLEFQGGIEYESCCWAVRTVLRRYLKNRDGEHRNAIYVELNLKGLASIGTRGRELFRD